MLEMRCEIFSSVSCCAVAVWARRGSSLSGLPLEEGVIRAAQSEPVWQDETIELSSSIENQIVTHTGQRIVVQRKVFKSDSV